MLTMTDDIEIPPEHERVGVKEASDQYGVAYSTLRWHINGGSIPSWKQKGRIILRRSDVQALRDRLNAMVRNK